MRPTAHRKHSSFRLPSIRIFFGDYYVKSFKRLFHKYLLNICCSKIFKGINQSLKNNINFLIVSKFRRIRHNLNSVYGIILLCIRMVYFSKPNPFHPRVIKAESASVKCFFVISIRIIFTIICIPPLKQREPFRLLAAVRTEICNCFPLTASGRRMDIRSYG